MGNFINMVQKELLFQLFELGWSDRKISKATHLHRNTVKRYRDIWKNQHSKKKIKIKGYVQISSYFRYIQNVPPKVPTDKVVHFEVPTDPPIPKQRSKAFKYDAIIREKLKAGQHARSIYQDLVTEHSYNGSYDSVKRYVRKLKKTDPAIVARIESPPGYEAQVDFGSGVSIDVNGKKRKTYIFVMTLSYSRHMYVEVVYRQDIETFIRCHENAFAYFGGVPKVIRLDNLKSGVIKAHIYEPVLNQTYMVFSRHYGFTPLPCLAGKPEHKGKVESGVKYCKNNALKGKSFKSLKEQNDYLRTWNSKWAYTRIHGTTKQQVKKMFEAEKAELQDLPATTFEYFKIGIRKVHLDIY